MSGSSLDRLVYTMDLLFSNLSQTENTTDCVKSSTVVLSTSAQVERVVKTFFLILIALTNILGNSSVCIVVLKDRQLRTSVRNYAVASLAVSDLLVVHVITFHVLTSLNIGKEPDICRIMGKVFGSLLYVSTLHLCALSLDRYVAIFYPLRYRFMVTPKRAVIILSVIWLLPVFSIVVIPAMTVGLQGFASFYGCVEVGSIAINDFKNRIHIYVNVTILFFLPVLVMMVAYYRISKVAWYQANRVGLAVVSVVRLARRPPLTRVRERKWAKTLAIVIGTFLFCYLPVVVASMIHARGGSLHGSPSIRKALEILLFPTYLNTALNPVIYSHRSNDYRRAFWKMFARCCRDSARNARPCSHYVRRESQTPSSYMTSST